MYFIVDKFGKQQGPFPINELRNHGVTGDTLVWKAGMPQWVKASQVEELAFLLNTPPVPPIPSGGTNNAYGYQNETHSVPASKPDNYMIWAILSTVCCCIPAGAYAIYCAAQVDSACRKGNYAEAASFSERAKTWSIISAVCGVVISIMSFFVALLSEI